MFEGMAQGGLGANWGDGHATDANLMNLVRPFASLRNVPAAICLLLVATGATNLPDVSHVSNV